MKEKLTNNWILKVGSVLLAVLLWLLVINNENPIVTNRLSGIPISFVNEDILTEKGKTFTVVGTQTVTVKYSVRKLYKNQVSMGDFTVTADLGALYNAESAAEKYKLIGTIDLAVEYTGDLLDSSSAYELVDKTVEIEIEDMVKNTFEIQVDTTGSVADGYVMGDISLNFSTVDIDAPESIMDKISWVGVTVDLDNRDKSIFALYDLDLYDAYGKVIEVNSSQLTMSESTVTVSIPILKRKTLTILPKVTGEDNISADYIYTGVVCEPTTIEVAGSTDVIDGLGDTLEIASYELDVTQASGDITKTIDITPYLDDIKVNSLDGNTELTITMHVEAAEEREYTINASQLHMSGENTAEYIYNLENGEEFIMTIKGRKSELDSLSADSISPSIDVTGLGVGTHTVPLQVSFSSETLTRVSPEFITISIKVPEDPSTDAPEPATTETTAAPADTTEATTATEATEATTVTESAETTTPESTTETIITDPTDPMVEGNVPDLSNSDVTAE